jgi:hypothetical protein
MVLRSKEKSLNKAIVKEKEQEKEKEKEKEKQVENKKAQEPTKKKKIAE